MSAKDIVARAVAFVLRLFFRRIEVTGLENMPADGGGVLVSWHPNGMIDPALIFSCSPRQVIFGARHGLFKWPLLGWLLRVVGTVPIYRAMDDRRGDLAARRQANERSLDALAERVAQGSFSCLFPEGDSHDEPHLVELKTGAARFYYRARQLSPNRKPVIVPIGLHYDEKRLFRSSVLVEIHPPIELAGELDVTPSADEPMEESRARARSLTERIERELREAVHATESWELHHLMHRARKLLRAERSLRAGAELDAPTMKERTEGFARVWTGYYARLQTHPHEVHALRARLAEYDAQLRALGLDDHELDRAPRLFNGWLAVLLGLQVVLVYFLLPPILWIGYLLNALPVGVLWIVTRMAARKRKDEASIKILVGAVLFPATWIAEGVLAGWCHSLLHAAYPAIPDTFVLAGFFTAVLAILGGAISLRYLRIARETARAARVRLTRERRRLAIANLRIERSELADALIALGEGLDLPGSVAPDGHIGESLPRAAG